MTVRVIKLGGRPVGDAGWLARFASVAARATDPIVVVHGGGPEVDALSARLGIGVERVGGRRVTPPEALEVAAMVLTGRINKRIVAALISAGVNALGVSGEDGSLVVADLVDGGALGRVGEVHRVRADLLRGLADLGLVPVISPISRGVDGGPLNVNADDAAHAIAAALDATELLFLTDVPAVHDGITDRTSLDADEAMALIGSGVIRDGMAVKVNAALRAIAAGVRAVRIGTLETVADPNAGTTIRPTVEATV